jgi:RNA-binding protein YlmH
MDKKTFLNMFKDHDKNYISSIYEDIQLCRNIEVPIYIKEFVTPDIYMNIKNNESKLGVFVYGTGVFDDSERKILCFSTNTYEALDYDIHVIRIKNKSKFKELKHKDYLGAIMALGVKRDLFGDLIVQGDACFVPMVNAISQYVQDNLTTIGNCPCSIDIVDISSEDIPKIKFEEKSIIVTSLRLDNVVPSICNMSRAKCTEFIGNGSVLLNYLTCNRKDKLVEMKDTITIRGFGKYKVNSIEGETSKGRLKLLIGKYI